METEEGGWGESRGGGKGARWEWKEETEEQGVETEEGESRGEHWWESW